MYHREAFTQTAIHLITDGPMLLASSKKIESAHNYHKPAFMSMRLDYALRKYLLT